MVVEGLLIPHLPWGDEIRRAVRAASISRTRRFFAPKNKVATQPRP